MPEIAEVARVVHQIRKRLVGQTIRAVVAKDDANIFGKVGTTAAEFQKVMIGKRIVDAGQQGKLAMSSPPHPLLHLGMSGWLHIKGETKLHFKSKATSNNEAIDEGEHNEDWPPKYWKFTFETFDSDTGNKKSTDDDSPIVKVSFTDPRRFGRVRLLDCAIEDIRKVSPLKENGPDPIIDKNILSLDWLQSRLCNKHVPIKTFLLDQANISGIGNWVGDEILYNAKIHPEQYSDTLTAQQMKVLYDCIMYVCETAVGVLADSEKFPSSWLFNYRWGKAKLTRTAKKKLEGSKDGKGQTDTAITCLPNGAKIAFITVGGRTCCIVPNVQQKKGQSQSDEEENENKSGKRGTRSKSKVKEEIPESNENRVTLSRKRRRSLDVPPLPGNTRKSPRFHKNSSATTTTSSVST
ncbi:Formamidopyrimidine-DNA glycosylase [Erysiphe neolycopersici]|uniref:Formamidopyrimidine-DNA glycosylase n=1 Tax=Erysiphe neolycopersici TaxID=212602 RepID=A0A420HPC6_9PEZI|nr:Formamidopyrimidine-DNA glycosylase [Erysiphe neolycopersici]